MSHAINIHDASGIAITDGNGKILFAFGLVAPADGVAGYSKGCIFVDTNGTAENILFVNAGSTTSADFNAIGTAGVAPSAAPTAVDATVIDATYGAPEQAVIDSIRVTLNEVVLALKAHGIMA